MGHHIKKNLHIVMTPNKLTISESQLNKVHVQKVSFSSKKKNLFRIHSFNQDLNKVQLLDLVMALNLFPSLHSPLVPPLLFYALLLVEETRSFALTVGWVD